MNSTNKAQTNPKKAEKTRKVGKKCKEEQNGQRRSIHKKDRRSYAKFNLSFGQPRSDTCPICDKFHIDIDATTDKTERNFLISQRNIHQQKADFAHRMLNIYCHKAEYDSSLEVYTFDFQQNLPAPSLSAGDMFYSRMLLTYNFGMHGCKTGDELMHLWGEVEAGRGFFRGCLMLAPNIAEET
ncbi:hpr kinase/phosphorylase [Plakobranchus ocellatus]|uniref:Hpr kinase/phosphorylase n=1 Tax=Plakobranchus ocellatus TaxID=259542 RepID=A0AAV4AIQ1_9GAST|nr:hpr kinase/phosphorylase [Plakobranchus ocellatus]